MDPIEQLYGHVVAMTRRSEGANVTTAASIAATVIHVDSTGDFDTDNFGQVVVGAEDDVYDYVAVDDDAATITLGSGLTTALAVDDRVDIYDPEADGRIVEYVAMVLLDESDRTDAPIEVNVQHGLVNLLAESVRGGATEAVTLVRDGADDFMIWQIDGKLVVDLVVEELGTEVGTIGDTLADLNADLTELNTVTLPGVAADIAALDGLFPITSTSISDDAITTPKLAANSVVASKIVALTITGDKIAANTISADKIVANSIGAGQIAANAITAGKIAANAIDGKTINGATITGGSISGALVEATNVISDLDLVSNRNVLVSEDVLAYGGITGGELYTGTSGTTGSAANCRIGSGGRLVVSTSSRRYKYDIEDAELDLEALLSVQPRTFRRYDDDNYDEAKPDAARVHVGLIAEEVDDLGLDSMVDRDAEGRPNGINWDVLGVHLLAVVKQQAAQIAALTARIGALEA